MTKGLTALQYHQAFNLHFNSKSDYEFFSYNGKTKANAVTFNKSPHKWQYVGIESRVEDIIYLYYLVWKHHKFNYVNAKQLFNTSRRLILNKNALDKDSFLNNEFKNDLQFLANKYNDDKFELFNKNGLYPNLCSCYTKGEIELETLLLLNARIKNVLNNDSSEDIVWWPSFVKEMMNVQVFVTYAFDIDKTEKLIADNYIAANK